MLSLQILFSLKRREVLGKKSNYVSHSLKMVPLVEKERKPYTTNIYVLKHPISFPSPSVWGQPKSHFLRKLQIVWPSWAPSQKTEAAPRATSHVLSRGVERTLTQCLNCRPKGLHEASASPSSTVLSCSACSLAREGACATRRDMWNQVQVTQRPTWEGGDSVYLNLGKLLVTLHNHLVFFRKPTSTSK